VMHHAFQNRAAQISGQDLGHGRQVGADWVVVMRDEQHAITVSEDIGSYSVLIDGTAITVQTQWQFHQPLFVAEIDGKAVCLQVERQGIAYRVAYRGAEADILVLNARAAELNALMPFKEPPDTSKLLLSPMPGLLVSVSVEAGQEVKAGDELAVVEAMKMENVLRAEKDQVVKTVSASAGDSLMVDQIIVEFE